MFKKLLLVPCLLFLSNCSAPGTALLGPAFTGAKTGSVYQASVSFSTGKIMNEFVASHNFSQNHKRNDPVIIASYKVDNISFSDVIEEEPLP